MPTSFVSPPQPTSPDTNRARFTIDGSDELERFLAGACELVTARVTASVPRHQIEGLLLAGGYGRSEGGVLTGQPHDLTRRNDVPSDAPYNDLEFYLFLRGNRFWLDHRYRPVLRDVAHELSESFGLEIEFKIMSLRHLRRASPSIFFYDMVVGHKWLIGDDTLLRACSDHRAAHLIPVSEATRLLMNRLSGLLLAREQLAARPFTAEHSDFVRRNIAKAKLAFGDAVLVAFGRYHWSCRERHRRLDQLLASLPDGEPKAWNSALLQHHAEGVAFKLHPWRSAESPEALQLDWQVVAEFARKLWLWLESQRLSHDFPCAREYALSEIPKWPGSNPFRNLLLNWKAFRRPILHKLFRHPRERVLESLVLLLWESDREGTLQPEARPGARASALQPSPLEPAVRDRLRQNLGATATDFAGAMAAYKVLWPSVS